MSRPGERCRSADDSEGSPPRRPPSPVFPPRWRATFASSGLVETEQHKRSREQDSSKPKISSNGCEASSELRREYPRTRKRRSAGGHTERAGSSEDSPPSP